MKPMDEINKVHHKNFLENDLPDKSIQLLIADSPYYQVKGDFDFIWKSRDEFLQDVELWAQECKRLLSDNGTLFWYGSAKNIAYVQIILDKHFNLESNAVVHIYDRQTNKIRPEDSRSFINVSERLLMYSNEIEKTGLQEIYDSPDCFKSIKKYMRDERDKLMLQKGFKTISKFNDFINDCTNTASVVSRHYFADSQYTFPVIEIYKKMQKTGFWQREYEDLRREYEDLRRPYYPTEEYKTEILRFSQEGHKTGKYDHDTVKPELISRYLIRTCSRKGDNVCIPFAGSGTECAMSKKEGRNFWGYDIEKKYADMANQRCYFEQPNLF